MKNEERQRTIAFILKAQAQFSDEVKTETREELEKLEDGRLDVMKSRLITLRRLERLENLLKLDLKNSRHERRESREKLNRLNNLFNKSEESTLRFKAGTREKER